ncbi:hypothetical protein PAXRUDRAFT_565967 [Paxillus rubicundulus Ve08.2h10]|uniref:Uncharacterized protein n=1 Tax=Paxillus rubicundulus Ve08.2h10 TaxID=930991 RepID=A0A0D0DUD0_9AGAM|nr:hypothetical protein PAXRUDRAFT_565967 [Paxillus rubicundulus Ve08.2h10]
MSSRVPSLLQIAAAGLVASDPKQRPTNMRVISEMINEIFIIVLSVVAMLNIFDRHLDRAVFFVQCCGFSDPSCPFDSTDISPFVSTTDTFFSPRTLLNLFANLTEGAFRICRLFLVPQFDSQSRVQVWLLQICLSPKVFGQLSDSRRVPFPIYREKVYAEHTLIPLGRFSIPHSLSSSHSFSPPSFR